ncbi:hypothetical protein FOPE_10916 [Fonsecaea pedrosoi]|nr:hypothetical protein FOPE_10916 [Fonsecaea pedrosoi]
MTTLVYYDGHVETNFYDNSELSVISTMMMNIRYLPGDQRLRDQMYGYGTGVSGGKVLYARTTASVSGHQRRYGRIQRLLGGQDKVRTYGH